MRKFRSGNSRDNSDGVAALNEVAYPNIHESEQDYQNIDKTWWQNDWVIIAITILLSVSDALTLYTIMDTVMVENQYVIIIITFTIALCLNFIPLVAAYLARSANKKSAILILKLGLLTAAFVILFALTVYLRWEARELNFLSSDTLVSEVSVETFADNRTETETDGTEIALTMVLAILPLITSIINFALGYIGFDPIKQKINKCKLRLIELSEMSYDLEAAFAEMEYNDRSKELLDLDEQRFKATADIIKSRCEAAKNYSKFRLAQYLKDPESITKLTEGFELYVLEQEQDDAP